jgi:hypothetical protein
MLTADYVQRESILREINLDKNISKLRGKIYAQVYSPRGKSFEMGENKIVCPNPATVQKYCDFT